MPRITLRPLLCSIRLAKKSYGVVDRMPKVRLSRSLQRSLSLGLAREFAATERQRERGRIGERYCKLKQWRVESTCTAAAAGITTEEARPAAIVKRRREVFALPLFLSFSQSLQRQKSSTKARDPKIFAFSLPPDKLAIGKLYCGNDTSCFCPSCLLCVSSGWPEATKTETVLILCVGDR